MVPGFAVFETSGRTDIGPLNTTTENTYRDFKTFVGLDTDVFSSPDLRGRYLNIHIANSDSQARIIGSGFGISIPDENVVTPSLYGNIANVVFFTRSAENVNIGRNASGIMIVGKTVKDIVIGDNNENIIMGGKNATPVYNGTTATTKNYLENITIGNNNRNVMISGANRRITIGNNNTGVVYDSEALNNTLGSYNTLVYSDYSSNNELGDWMTNIRLSHSSNIVMGSECQTIDLIGCGTAAGGTLFLNGSTTATFPDGFNTTTGQTWDDDSATINIGDRATNVIAYYSSPFHLESQVQNIVINRSGSVKIGLQSQNISLYNTNYVNIGENVQHCEIHLTNNLDIEEGCTGIKLFSNVSESTTRIGANSSTVGVYMGSADVEVGEFSSNIFVSGTAIKTKIGKNNSNVILRASSYTTIGNNNDEIFLEGSSYGTIGDNNSNISLADVGGIYKPGFPSFTTYSWIFNDAVVGRDYAGRTYVTGSTQPFVSSDWATSLGTHLGLGFAGCSRVSVGNNCDEVFIVSVRDNTTNIAIGCDADSSNTYTLGNTSGYMNSLALSAVTTTTVTGGSTCHETVIGANCDEINVIGVAQSGNTFYDNVTNVYAVSGFTFTNNRVFIDGNAVTATTSYDGINFDKNSPDGNRWEVSVTNVGGFGTPVKLE
jgi:hypothetical protein